MNPLQPQRITGGFRPAGTTKDEAGAALLDKLLALQSATPNGDITSLENAIARATEKMGCRVFLDKWLTCDPAMRALKDKVLRLSVRNEPVTITGPSGSGKEVLAKALHGDRSGKFIAINCGGLSKDLVPSTFFGHVKGAFTGAHETRRGLLVEAANGTVFLDEIAELPLDVQAVLLRAIQENEIYPVGSADAIPINCRFVAATKEPLEEYVNQKKFRDDLFGRLFTFRLHITGFNVRPADVRLILESQPGWPTLVAQYESTPEVLDIDNNQQLSDDIKRYGVRAIQAFVLRMLVLGSYN